MSVNGEVAIKILFDKNAGFYWVFLAIAWISVLGSSFSFASEESRVIVKPYHHLPNEYSVFYSYKMHICPQELEDCLDVIGGFDSSGEKYFVSFISGTQIWTYDFYGKLPEEFRIDGNRIVLIFTPDTEQYGWINSLIEDDDFRYFYDPEL